MAIRVPTLDNFSVLPDAGRQPEVSAPEISDVGARQMVSAGNAIQQGGDMLSKIALDRQVEANQLRVTDALNRAKETATRLTFDKDTGYTTVKGFDALNRPDGKTLTDDYSLRLGKELSTIQQGLGNEAQRRAFSKAGMELMSGFRTDIIKHEAKEFENYATSVDEGVIANAQSAMGLYYNDPEKINENRQALIASSRRLGQRLGKSAEWIDAHNRDLLSKGHLVALATAVEKNDISYAEHYLDHYRDDMQPEDILRVEGLITKEKDAIVANDAATEVYTNQPAATADGNVIRPIAGDWGSGSGQAYGAPRAYGGHTGVDKAVPVGTPVSAPESGTLRIRKTRGGGNEAWIETDNGRLHKLLHLSGYAEGLKDGDPVRAGQVIAKSGDSGTASHGAHLHWSMYENGKPVDPTKPHARRGYAGKSLEDMLLELQSHPDLAGHPDRLRAAEQQVMQLYQANREKVRLQREQAEQSVYDKLWKNGGNTTALSAAERDALGPDGLRGALGFANQVQAERNGTLHPDYNLWADLKLNPAKLGAMSATDIIKLRPQLGAQAFNDLVTDKAAIDKGDTAALSSMDVIKGGIDSVKADLAAAGLDTTPKVGTPEAEQFAQFQTQYVRLIQAEQQATGKKVTPDRAREIALSLVSKQIIKPGGFLGFGKKEQFRFEGGRPSYESIPQGVRSALIQSLQRRHPGQRVTQAMVRDEYTAFMYQGQ